MTRPSQPLWWSLVVLVVSMLLVGAGSIWYADRTARASERRWCGLISTMDRAYRETPPATGLGQDLAARIAELRRKFGCPR